MKTIEELKEQARQRTIEEAQSDVDYHMKKLLGAQLVLETLTGEHSGMEWKLCKKSTL